MKIRDIIRPLLQEDIPSWVMENVSVLYITQPNQKTTGGWYKT